DSLAWKDLKERTDLKNPQEVEESAAMLERMMERADEALVAAQGATSLGKEELDKVKQWTEDLRSELELRQLLARYSDGYVMEDGKPVLPEDAPAEDKEKLGALLEDTSQL
ncbi:MAG: hypothetical protein ACOCX1_02980, partial [Fimbriimonadaceae bacterium]